LVAILVIVLLSLINYFGLIYGSIIQNITSILKIGALIANYRLRIPVWQRGSNQFLSCSHRI